MTYDELLEVINVYNDGKGDSFANALRAIVEMCKPSDWDNDDNFYWKKALLETIGRELK